VASFTPATLSIVTRRLKAATAQPEYTFIAKQRPGKHVPESAIFYVVHAATVAMRRRGKHASSAIKRLRFLRCPCRGVILKTNGVISGVEGSVVEC
jgi:hypothetical protein